MALPKKGTRTIIVDGIKYRYRGYATHYEGDDYADLIIEKEDKPRQKIQAHFTWTRLKQAYGKVGHSLSKIADTLPPYVVRHTILYALANGWTPNKGGGVLKLGNLDEKLDFSQLNAEAQNPLMLDSQLK